MSVKTPNQLADETATIAPQAAPAGFDFSAAGLAFRASDVALSRRLAELGESLRGLSFDAWMAARASFIAGAEADGKYQDGAKLWERTIARGIALDLIDPKPKATTAEATKKADQRARAKTEAEAAMERGAATLREEAKQAAALGKYREAAKLTALAERAVKQADRDAQKAAADALAPMLDAIKAGTEACKKANDRQGLELIARVAACVAAGQHGKVAKLLKSLHAPAEAVEAASGAEQAAAEGEVAA